LGAGTKIANLRFDDVPVKMSISIYPGVGISSGTWIEAETLVRKDV
jgi:hypothetical protein